MKKISMAALAATLIAGGAFAGGVERSSQSVGILFEKGRYAEVTFGAVVPTVSGVGLNATATGIAKTGDIVPGFGMLSFGYKQPLNDKLDLAIILDEPIGAKSHYPESSDYLLRGVTGEINATGLTSLLRYKLPNNLSVYGGVRIQRLSGNTTVPLVGYTMNTSKETDLGYVIGAAWEKPEIGARVALTYNSKITHSLEATERFGATTINDRFDMTVPESINLEFQTGINPKTLLLGSVRWVRWSEYEIAPPAYAATINPMTGQPFGPLVSYASDVTTVQLGLGRKFSDRWSGALMLGYEHNNGDIAPNLGPTNGMRSVTLVANYQPNDKIKITGGVTYVDIGSAKTSVGSFDDNHAWGAGVRVGMSF